MVLFVGHIPFLPDLVLILGAGVVAALAVAFLRLPAVAGFMLAGAVVGPSGFGLVRASNVVDVLAEIGVVLLLFTIGLELSVDGLRRIWRLVAVGGALQVGLTTAITTWVALGLGYDVAKGVFFGFLVALSSTAIVLRGLSERDELEAPHGRFTLGALIFQDLCIVPMVLLVPILAGQGSGTPAADVALALLKAAAVVLATLAVGRFLIPPLLAQVDAANSREVFLLAVLVVCTGIALATAFFGLSLALGAFLAGMLLSQSAFGERAMANVLPLRDLLTSLFFMSLGMLFDVTLLRDEPVATMVLFMGLFLGKGLIATLASLAMRFPARVAWLSGVGLAQFGEFGFVLAKEGMTYGLLEDTESSLLLTAGLLTMFVTPLSIRLAPHVTAGATMLRPLERLLGARGIDEPRREDARIHGHVIIAGYGLAGRGVAIALRSVGAPYLVLDLDYEEVRAAQGRKEPVYYADATHEEALRHAHITEAAALVVVIDDVAATRRVIALARSLAPRLPILARCRRKEEEDRLRVMGAIEVVTEEVEGGIEMLARVLRERGTPLNVIGPLVAQARAESGSTVRKTTLPRRRLGELRALDEMKIEPVELGPEMAAIGRSLAMMRLRARSKATVVALQRGAELMDAVPADLLFEPGDILFLAGSREAIFAGLTLLRNGPPEGGDGPVQEERRPTQA
ncbi:MAG: cation:proton antiporter [Myxococcota bacterium]